VRLVDADPKGTEIVQLYIKQLVGEVVRPVKELKGFKRVTLDPGKKKTVIFNLPATKLAYHNQEKKLVTDAGKYKVWIGKNSAKGLEGSFEIK